MAFFKDTTDGADFLKKRLSETAAEKMAVFHGYVGNALMAEIFIDELFFCPLCHVHSPLLRLLQRIYNSLANKDRSGFIGKIYGNRRERARVGCLLPEFGGCCAGDAGVGETGCRY